MTVLLGGTVGGPLTIRSAVERTLNTTLESRPTTEGRGAAAGLASTAVPLGFDVWAGCPLRSGPLPAPAGPGSGFADRDDAAPPELDPAPNHTDDRSTFAPIHDYVFLSPQHHRRLEVVRARNEQWPSARTDHDTWDLATTVGATATMVAAARAAASRRADPIIRDPLAEPLVRAVGVDFFVRLATGELDFADVGDAGSAWMPDVFAIRTHFFDAFLCAARQDGIRQMVIVASGLDSRAYRLPWPTSTVVYEIDQPDVIEFKSATLSRLGASPTAFLRSVGIDLRSDWPAALQQAGFDTAQPAAWIAEGLLIGFLPGDAQNHLLDDITALSAPGSRLAADHLPNHATGLGTMMRAIGERWREYGLDADLSDLYFAGDRGNVEAGLKTRGWETVGSTLDDLFRAAVVGAVGRALAEGPASDIRYVTALRA